MKTTKPSTRASVLHSLKTRKITCPAPYDPLGVVVVTPTMFVPGDPEVSTVTAVATGTPDARLPREFGSVNEASRPAPPPAFTSRMEVLDWLGQPDWSIRW